MHVAIKLFLFCKTHMMHMLTSPCEKPKTIFSFNFCHQIKYLFCFVEGRVRTDQGEGAIISFSVLHPFSVCMLEEGVNF